MYLREDFSFWKKLKKSVSKDFKKIGKKLHKVEGSISKDFKKIKKESKKVLKGCSPGIKVPFSKKRIGHGKNYGTCLCTSSCPEPYNVKMPTSTSLQELKPFITKYGGQKCGKIIIVL